MKKRLCDHAEEPLNDAVATAEVVFSLGQSEAQAIAAGLPEVERRSFAESLTAAALSTYWKRRSAALGSGWKIRDPVAPVACHYGGVASRLGSAMSSMPDAQAGYLAGQLYTALLPDAVRKTLGAFYTPPPLADRLLELITASGFDWGTGRIIDPACGGAAFLVPVAPRLVAASRHRTPLAAIEDLEARLVGVEIDGFAAWMAMVLLDVALLELTTKAGRPVRPLVVSRDALRANPNELGTFDLVVGNPPYGKVSLPPDLRERFRESLFGHANLYGVFTELAVRLVKDGGRVAYVTPTSFLGGEYFKNLRTFLSKHAPLQRLEFVNRREGVFDGVLQETMLAVFRRRAPARNAVVRVNVLHTDAPAKPATVESVGQIPLESLNGSPWLLPRSRAQTPLVSRLNATPHRLADYGFAVSTGQLVWNRHKDQLQAQHGRDCYPIVWAEAVGSDGQFQFQAARRGHLPYLKLKPGQDWLINQEPCILVQRTTAKEQKRRLIAAVIPNSFVVEYPGFVVENHLNMIYARSARPPFSLRTLAALLNSALLDQIFRCINGSVAVSAYELNALPLPRPEAMQGLQELVLAGASPARIEDHIADFYTAQYERNGTASSSHPRFQPRPVAA